MNILILGVSGLVGSVLFEELKNHYLVFGTYHTRIVGLPQDKMFQLDVGDSSKLNEILDITKPEIIISCLRGNFEEQIKCHQEVANYLKGIGGKIVFCSTWNVFDGNPSKPHCEVDKPISFSKYGRFKIACEKLLKKTLGENAVIVRLPGILGEGCSEYKGLKEEYAQGCIELLSNVYVTKTTNLNVAKDIHLIIQKDLKGIFHLTSKEVMSYYEFLDLMVKKLGLENPTYKEQECTKDMYYLALQYVPGEDNIEIDEDKIDKYYLALRSIRDEIPQDNLSNLLG